MNTPKNLFSKKKLSMAITAALLSVVVSGCNDSSSSTDAKNPDTDAPATQTRVDALISKMTLQQKVDMLMGAQEPRTAAEATAAVGYLKGVPELGIPAVRLTDGPAGIRLIGTKATAMPAPVALAASFDTKVAREIGQATGAEGKALRQDVLLSPMVNIVRVPQAGRNFETLGEDPLLAGAMVAEQIKGIQEAGLIATVKHYVANNQEDNRRGVNATIDERTLNEIYLPAFKDAVDAGVGAVMCAYNQVNGTPACSNGNVQNNIMRDRWGFEGFIMSDWGATHDSSKAITNGQDMDMPGYGYGGMMGLNFAKLKEEVESGQLEEAIIDKSVHRVLVQMEKFGLLDGPQTIPSIEKQKVISAVVAKKVAVEGAVLLRNENNTLPLTLEQLKAAVVIGHSAAVPIIGGGGSSKVDSFTKKGPLAAFKDRGADVKYLEGIYLQGSAIPTANFLAEDGITQGLSMHKGETVTVDSGIIDYVGEGKELAKGSSTIWKGSLVIEEEGDYEFKAQSSGGQALMFIDGREGRPLDLMGEVVADIDTASIMGGSSLLAPTDGLELFETTMHLTAGKHEIEIEGNAGKTSILRPQADTPLEFRLTWITPKMRVDAIKDAAAAAAEAKETGNPVILFAYNEGTESRDRQSLSLPALQEDLIAAVTTANPNTIVVLNTGDPISMPWKDNTAAILEMWYSGQEGAEATTDLLLGVANPSGKLPVTFPVDLESGIAIDPNDYPGVNNEQEYSEGIFVGYRWYEEQNKAPLFPFGFGLSYTEFEYSATDVTPNEDGGYKVSFTVTNIGEVNGSDAPQVYLGEPKTAPVAMAKKSLAGFTKVNLAPGASTTVVIDIKPRAFKYWSVANGDWTVASGERVVYLGHSSADVKAIGTASK